MVKKRRKPRRHKNVILAIIAKNNPTMLRDRTVEPEKGNGRKDRPRNKNLDEFFDCAA
jgi:hypothetical protein